MVDDNLMCRGNGAKRTRYEPVEGSCEHGSESLGSINGWEFLY
jgi:hypothetical protein